MNKSLVFLAIVIGEILMIYAEIAGARDNASTIHGDMLWKIYVIGALGFCATLTGYVFGIYIYKNIWIVTVISIVTILIVEPPVAYFMTRQAPTRGALIGFILGALGLLAALFYK